MNLLAGIPTEVAWPLALLVAWVAGELGHRWTRLPRISLYSLTGFALGGSQLGLLPDGNAALLLLANVAFGLILFELGYRINLRWLRANPWMGVSSLAEALLTFGGVFLAGALVRDQHRHRAGGGDPGHVDLAGRHPARGQRAAQRRSGHRAHAPLLGTELRPGRLRLQGDRGRHRGPRPGRLLARGAGERAGAGGLGRGRGRPGRPDAGAAPRPATHQPGRHHGLRAWRWSSWCRSRIHFSSRRCVADPLLRAGRAAPAGGAVPGPA